jgi:hypothetical protein
VDAKIMLIFEKDAGCGEKVLLCVMFNGSLL